MTFFCLQGHSSDLPLELSCNGQSQRGKSISTIQLVSLITTQAGLFCCFFFMMFLAGKPDSRQHPCYLLDRGDAGSMTRQFLEVKQQNIKTVPYIKCLEERENTIII